MRSLFSIAKVPFSAAVLGTTALLFTSFATFRPNRIAAGKVVALTQTQGTWWILVVTLWVALLAVSVFRAPVSLKLACLGAISSILIVLTVFLAGRYAAVMAARTGSIARVSLGPAFWVSLFALLILLTDSWQRSQKPRTLLTLMAAATGCGILWMLLTGNLGMLSIMREYSSRQERFIAELLTHMFLAGSSVGLAVALGIPLGILAHRRKGLYGSTFFTLNTLQTIPSLALFGILIPILAAVTARYPLLAQMGIKGIGSAPAIIALTVYSLLPVARNTYTGFATVDPAATEAGAGMGMTRTQLLLRVEAPIASPVILNGIRVALVQAIGLTAVAALIGAGGMGVFIFQGLGQAADDLILLGAIPTILIAVIVDATMSGVIQAVKPKGLR